MRQLPHKFASLMSVMTVLWSLCQGRPTDPGPTCAEELPNAHSIISWLQKSLKEFNKTLVNEGFGGREFTGPVCILSNADIEDQSMDLHTIDRRLCQYNMCFKHFEGVIREFNTLQNSFELCWKFLHQLDNTIKKMKRQPPASCTAPWSYNHSRWDEITKVPHLTQELLKYLEQLKLSCH